MHYVKSIVRLVKNCIRSIVRAIKQRVFLLHDQKKIYNRIKQKVENGEKIRVIFVCHRPAVWGAMKTVYEAFREDSFFDTSILTVPQRDIENPDLYFDNGADSFFERYDPIIGYSSKENSFLDLRTLAPDIVFFQQPYDIMRNAKYWSDKVCRYAQIAYISYFSVFPDALNDDEVLNTCYPMDFFQKLTYFFSQNSGEDKHIRKLLDAAHIRHVAVSLTGYPKYDDLSQYVNCQCDVWKNSHDDNRFRVIWTPRWTTNENSCFFFEYKDKWLDYCQGDDSLDFVFRPHPQAWIEWSETGEFTESQQEKLRNRFDGSDNMVIDESGEYLHTFYTSDCLVTDISSLIYQYFLTGKPIIFCHNPKSAITIRKDSLIGTGLYYAENWDEVEMQLNMLRRGEDSLKERRKEIIEKEFCLNTDVKSGAKIMNAIKESILNHELNK